MVYLLFSLLLAQDIKVMVVDTGVSSQVPEIAKYLASQDKVDLSDDHGHGTHIAGIVLYGPDLKTPVCNRVKLYSCKFLTTNSKKEPVNLSAECFKKARELGMEYVNFSAGGNDFYIAEFLQLLVLTQRTKVVVAAGNHNNDITKTPYYPASYNMKNIDVVGSGSGLLNKDKYSNYGLNDMIWRKGKEIKSFGIKKRYVTMSGTSQATAVRTHELLQEECKK
jgi:major intracellular serine protease